MRSPNGYGSIAKMGGKRRNPYRVQITTGWEFVKDEDGDLVLDDNGEPKMRRVRKTMGYYPSRQAAMIALAEYNKSPYDLDVATVTWLDVWDKWGNDAIKNASKSLAPQLKKAHERCAPLYSMKMKDIRKGHMQDILDSVSDMSATSQQRLKYVMTQNFKWALENDVVVKDYSQFLTVDVKQKEEELHFPFTTDEIKALWKHEEQLATLPVGKSRTTTVQAHRAMLVLIYTGMRVMELGELKAADVHLEERYIDLRGTKTKSAKRFVPLHKDIIPVIEKLLADGGEHLVVSGLGKPLRYDQWNTYVLGAANEAAGGKHTLHDTRHTFISAAERSGLAAESIILKRIVGHSTKGNTTAIYTHKDLTDLLEAIDKVALL